MLCTVFCRSHAKRSYIYLEHKLTDFPPLAPHKLGYIQLELQYISLQTQLLTAPYDPCQMLVSSMLPVFSVKIIKL